VRPARSATDQDAPSSDGAFRVEAAWRARRVRNAAVWSIALFVAFVPAALLGGGAAGDSDGAAAGRGLALLFGLTGFATGAWAFALAFRSWDMIPLGIRWLATLPLLVVLSLLALSMLLAVLLGPVGGKP
jgi:hypothetical protein